jgi:hypothetical protein
MPRTAEGAGAAYVYAYDDGWMHQAYLKGDRAPLTGMRFGWAVAAGGGRLAVAARDESGGGRGVNPPADGVVGASGAVFLFE